MKKFIFIVLFLLLLIKLHSEGKVIGFIENKGQWDSNILFIAKTKNANIYITKTKLSFETYNVEKETNQVKNYQLIERDFADIKTDSVNAYKSSSYYLNFYIGNSPDKWVKNVHSYSEVKIFNLNNDNSINLSISESNILNISYSFKEKNSIQKNKFDELQSIISSSFLGGESYDIAEDIKLTKNKEIVVAGYTYSNNFPISDSAYQKELKYLSTALPDLFVSKFDANAENLIFSTYIGGLLDDYAKSIAIDENDDIYITGYTSGTSSFPSTPDAYSTRSKGGFDCFVSKLSSDGKELLFSTLLGGAKDDYSQAIAIDSQGNSYITGYTYFGSDFPISENAFQKENKGEFDVFLSKFNSDGSKLLFSTLLGGDGEDFGQAIHIFDEQNVYLSGFTSSTDFPISEDAFCSFYSDTSQIISMRSDIFLSKINTISGQLDYSTYIGGSAKDGAYALSLDSENNIILAGVSESSDFPVTKDSYCPLYANKNGLLAPGDAILLKFNQKADSLLFSTYLGGTSADRIYGLTLDSLDNIYVVGTSASKDFPVTNKLSAQAEADENTSNAFISKFSSRGDSLFFSTYLGGNSSDVGKAIALIEENKVVVAGTTSSTDFPVGKNAFDSTYNDRGFSDCFVTVLNTLNFSVFAGEDIEICKTRGVFIGNEAKNGIGRIEYSWQPNSGIRSPNSAITYAEPDTTTLYTLQAVDEKNNIAISQIKITVKPNPVATFKGPQYVFPNTQHSYLALSTNPNWHYEWLAQGGELLEGQGTEEPVILWNDDKDAKLLLIIKNEFDCADSSEILEMKIGNAFKAVIYYDDSLSLCEGDSLILRAGRAYKEYRWSSGGAAQYDTVRYSGNYWLEVVDLLGNAGLSDTIQIAFQQVPDTPVLAYEKPYLICKSKEHHYQWYFNGEALENETSDTLLVKEDGNYFLEVKNLFGCKNRSNIIYVVLSSVEENGERNIALFPNPVENILNIRFSNDLKNLFDVKIFDVYSNLIYEAQNINLSSEGIYSIDLKALNSGLYFMQINWKSGTQDYKNLKYYKFLKVN